MDNTAPVTNETLISEAEQALSKSFEVLFHSTSSHAVGPAARVIACAYALSVLKGTPIEPPSLLSPSATS